MSRTASNAALRHRSLSRLGEDGRPPGHRGLRHRPVRRCETGTWPRYGVKGAAVHLKGRGDFANMFVFEIPPGGSTAPQRHLYEEVVYVLEGQRQRPSSNSPTAPSAASSGAPRSLFAIPLNAKHRHFNASGRERALLVEHHQPAAGAEHLPQRGLRLRQPISTSPSAPASSEYFSGEGDLITVRPGNHMWETNFVPDLASIELKIVGRPRRRRHQHHVRARRRHHARAHLGDAGRHLQEGPPPRAELPRDVRDRPGLSRCCGTRATRTSAASTGSTAWCSRRPTGSSTSTSTPAPQPARYLATGVGGLRYPTTSANRVSLLGAKPTATSRRCRPASRKAATRSNTRTRTRASTASGSRR